MPVSSRDKPNGSPVARELFKNRAYDELRSRLFSNQYPPGTLLSERQLAAELGMSKTPIKAALERLEMEGFVSVSPQQGIIVCDLSDKEIADLYEIRIALEGYVLKSLAGRLTPEQWKRWNVNLSALSKNTGAPRNRRRAVALDTEFHILPCEFLGNHQILKTMQQLSNKIEIVINRVFALMPNRASESLIEHRSIMRAVRSGNGQRAASLVEAHLRLGHHMLSVARVQ
jgi:DNA-binding GntR family transcriptional regulator